MYVNIIAYCPPFLMRLVVSEKLPLLSVMPPCMRVESGKDTILNVAPGREVSSVAEATLPLIVNANEGRDRHNSSRSREVFNICLSDRGIDIDWVMLGNCIIIHVVMT